MNMLTKAIKQYDSEVFACELSGHAYDHYMQSKHVYAMEIETKKVWHFAKENYVHRLIQNEVDGKLVEIGEVDQISDKNLNS